MTKYRPIRQHIDHYAYNRWVIEVTDDAGDVFTMSCGANPTYAEVTERIQFLEQDDARCDASGRNEREQVQLTQT